MRSGTVGGVFLTVWLAGVALGQPADPPRGLRMHDPSTIQVENGRYYVFGTGRGIISLTSTDLTHWVPGPRVFDAMPAWTTNAIPGARDFWAPDLLKLNGQYYLYYSVSTFGTNVSALGLATNPTLDPTAPNYRWTDQGMVLRCYATNDYNTIDPAPFRDKDGKLWLVFGSFWSGIKMVLLDPATGKPQANAPLTSLAWNPSIEAAYLHRHGEYYYLFVNWGTCCQGLQSTYNIRVGRSRVVTGPYLDREGKDLLKGGGSLFLDSQGKFHGPGHAGIVTKQGQDWFSYHYYNGDNGGVPALDVKPLTWDAHGWPKLKE